MAPVEEAKSSRRFNFSAGPAMLPDLVLDKIVEELGDYEGLGMSILEMGHRDAGGPVQQVLQEATDCVRHLLRVPANYAVIWQQGGAHGQFAAVPLNLLGDKTQADYVDTGVWSKRAMNEAGKFCTTRICAEVRERQGKAEVPPVSEWDLSDKSAYVHICANDTISGVEFLEDPDVGDRLLVADFTSTLLSRPVNISRYAALYCSSGKNLGPAGVCLVIVRRDLPDLDSKDYRPVTAMFAFTSLGWHRHDQTTRPPTALPALPLPCGADVTGRVPAWSGGLRTVGLAVASMALKTRSRVVRKGRSASSPETPRRCALMSTMAVLCPGTLGAGQRASAKGNPFVLLQDGMEAFRNYKVEDSIKFFDEAAESGYPKARLWQRGLSLYYAERFEEGTQQFRKDVEVNPNDTEESLWAFLCEARMVGFEQARKQMMTVGFDPRPVMGSVYALYKGDDDAKYVARLEELYQKGGSDAFYASLYLGLYYEAKADTESAKLWLLRSVESKYGQSSNDYMADLARVHVARRQWRAEL